MFEKSDTYFNGYFLKRKDPRYLEEAYIASTITGRLDSKISGQLDVSMGNMFPSWINVFAVPSVALQTYLLTKLII